MSHESHVIESSSSYRKKLWQLEHRFHCSVAGTCLSLRELRELCQKIRTPIPEAIGDYELHCAFVAAIGQPGKLAKATHRYLDRKFAAFLRRFRNAKDEDSLKSLWRSALQEGEIAGAFWAAVTHPSANERFLFYLFGDVHMLSHLHGSSLRADMARMARLKREREDLRQALETLRQQSQRRLQEKNARISELEAQARAVAGLRQRLRVIEHQLLNWQSGAAQARLNQRLAETQAHCNHLAARCERLEAELADWRRRTKAAENERDRLSAQWKNEQRERLSLEAALTNLLTCGKTKLGTPDLKGRRILYVGGFKRQWPSFRALVERRQGELITHDGGREDNRSSLDNLLAQADWVLCPLGQISHDAVQRIKNACRRRHKPFLLLSSTSLSAFIHGLGELGQRYREETSWPLITKAS